jgi:hypothetical protein
LTKAKTSVTRVEKADFWMNSNKSACCFLQKLHHHAFAELETFMLKTRFTIERNEVKNLFLRIALKIIIEHRCRGKPTTVCSLTLTNS